jgi:hypothetical protein
MTTKETITVTKTVEIHHGTKARFLPGDQRFILWYGLCIGQLVVASTIGEFVQSVRTDDGREWLLKRPVRKQDVVYVLHDADVGSNLDDPHGPLMAANPWCPAGLEKAWYDSAVRRLDAHTPKEA